MLIALAGIVAVGGYQGSIVTQAISFVVDDFGSSKAEQGRALAAIRLDILLTIGLVRLADRVGRRKVVLTCATVAPLLTALTSLTNGLPAFVCVQIIARAFVTATLILVGVIGVEQMDARNRGWASSILVAAAALGSALLAVPVFFADRTPGFWRVMFLPPLIGLVAVAFARRRIVETDRFDRLAKQRASGVRDARFGEYRNRLIAIGSWLILMGLFTTPARQFLNDYLREERGFTAQEVSVFGILTNIPGVLGVLFGGAISDRKGRRIVIAVGLVGYALSTGAMYVMHGPALWTFAMAGSMFGAFALPGLGILVPELFPTALRSQASGFSTGFNRIGSAIGLFLAGTFAGHFSVGTTLAVMSTSLLIGAVIVVTAVPEPAGRELEQVSDTTSTSGPSTFA